MSKALHYLESRESFWFFHFLNCAVFGIFAPREIIVWSEYDENSYTLQSLEAFFKCLRMRKWLSRLLGCRYSVQCCEYGHNVTVTNILFMPRRCTYMCKVIVKDTNRHIALFQFTYTGAW